MYKITIESYFDAAHRLSNYKGKCQNIHGHRWTTKLTIGSKVLNLETDMLIDFKILKDNLNKILDKLDHGTILKNCEENRELINIFTKTGFCLVLLEKEPTAEYLAEWIYKEFSKVFNFTDIEILNVRVYESPNAYADYNE